MDWRVAHGVAGSDTDVDARSGARIAQHGDGERVHALAVGSPVAACGAPVGQVTDATWPPVPQGGCERCERTVATYLA